MTQAAAQFLRQQARQLRDAGDFVKAEAQLRAAIAIFPDAPILHLELGEIFERQGNVDSATRAYYRAVMKARAKGLWLDEATVPPALLPQVLSAMQFVEAHRNGVLQALLEPLYAGFGKAELARVTQALNIYLKLDATKPANPAQRPLFLYVPGLTETPYWDAKRFAWINAALAARAGIIEEARAVLERRNGLQPFLNALPGQNLDVYLGTSPQNSGAALQTHLNPMAKPRWDAHFFYRHGQAIAENLAASPATAALLAQMPLVKIAEHAPEICFSVLAPGTHIKLHTGVTNLRLVAHLPLILPGDCALKVAGIERAWCHDEVLVFDDTFEHEAWNRSDGIRVILLMDAWHPDLRESERVAFAELVEGIGCFNRG